MGGTPTALALLAAALLLLPPAALGTTSCDVAAAERVDTGDWNGGKNAWVSGPPRLHLPVHSSLCARACTCRNDSGGHSPGAPERRAALNAALQVHFKSEQWNRANQKQMCESANQCFDPIDGAPWCYEPRVVPPECDVPTILRDGRAVFANNNTNPWHDDQSYQWNTDNQRGLCLAQGLCFEAKAGGPWCYVPRAASGGPSSSAAPPPSGRPAPAAQPPPASRAGAAGPSGGTQAPAPAAGQQGPAPATIATIAGVAVGALVAFAGLLLYLARQQHGGAGWLGKGGGGFGSVAPALDAEAGLAAPAPSSPSPVPAGK
jgi:hypothetical protein